MNTFDKKRHVLRICEGLAEIILLAFLYYATWQYYLPYMGTSMFAFRGKYVLIGIYAFLVYIVFRGCDSLNIGNLKITDAIISQSISIFIVNVITYLQVSLLANTLVSPIPLMLLTVLDWACAFVCVLIFTRIYHNSYVTRNMIMVYGSRNALTLVEKFNGRRDKYDITEVISINQGLGTVIDRIKNHDAVIVNDISADDRNEIMKYCYENGIRIYMVPRLTDVIFKASESLTLFDTPLELVGEIGIMPEQAFAKRTLDLLVAVIALIPCILIILLVGIAIKIEDGGPVFYKQTRVTLGNRQFGMLKFRSMIVDAEKQTGAVLAEADDPRITKVGRFLRRHRLDEIPQVFNVLTGEMSIVGPRPERPELISQIESTMPEYRYRTKVKGGITGYAQVYGKYNTVPYDKLKYDLMYIENYSLFLDIKIILMTPQILLRKESTEGVKR